MSAPTEESPSQDEPAPSGEEPYPAPGVPTPEGGDGVGPGYPPPGEPAPSEPCLPAEPQEFEFQSGDGTTLTGTYYPPKTCGAPVVVLMHQFSSDQTSWVDLALWLQNRTDSTTFTGGILAMPALQYEWFPIAEDLSCGVLTFDFRGHGKSESAPTTDEGLLMDARAAVAFARTLEGIDPNRVITMGASIGADGAVDACVSLDGSTVAAAQEDQGCIGAMSFSPGNYLGVNYTGAANALLKAPHDAVIYCLAAENDGGSPAACNSVSGDDYKPVIYPGNDHGMALIQPGRDPAVGQLVLDFLLESMRLK
ncbi:MAG: alpha/beta hydrolase [Anaerolineales bacterium]